MSRLPRSAVPGSAAGTSPLLSSPSHRQNAGPRGPRVRRRHAPRASRRRRKRTGLRVSRRVRPAPAGAFVVSDARWDALEARQDHFKDYFVSTSTVETKSRVLPGDPVGGQSGKLKHHHVDRARLVLPISQADFSRASSLQSDRFASYWRNSPGWTGRALRSCRRVLARRTEARHSRHACVSRDRSRPASGRDGNALRRRGRLRDSRCAVRHF